MTGHSDCSERALARVGYGDDSQLENAPPRKAEGGGKQPGPVGVADAYRASLGITGEATRQDALRLAELMDLRVEEREGARLTHSFPLNGRPAITLPKGVDDQTATANVVFFAGRTLYPDNARDGKLFTAAFLNVVDDSLGCLKGNPLPPAAFASEVRKGFGMEGRGSDGDAERLASSLGVELFVGTGDEPALKVESLAWPVRFVNQPRARITSGGAVDEEQYRWNLALALGGLVCADLPRDATLSTDNLRAWPADFSRAGAEFARVFLGYPDPAEQAKVLAGTPRERGAAARAALGIEGPATLADAQRLAVWVNVRVSRHESLNGALQPYGWPPFGAKFPCASLYVGESASDEQAAETIAAMVGELLSMGHRPANPGSPADAGEEFAEGFLRCPVETAARELGETMRRALDLTGPATLPDVACLAEWQHFQLLPRDFLKWTLIAMVPKRSGVLAPECAGKAEQEGEALAHPLLSGSLSFPSWWSEAEKAREIASTLGGAAVAGWLDFTLPVEEWPPIERRIHRAREAFCATFLGWPEGFRTPEQLAREKREELGIKGPATYADVLRLTDGVVQAVQSDVLEEGDPPYVLGSSLLHPPGWVFAERSFPVWTLAESAGCILLDPWFRMARLTDAQQGAARMQEILEASNAAAMAFTREFLRWPDGKPAESPATLPRLAKGERVPEVRIEPLPFVLTWDYGDGRVMLALPKGRTEAETRADLEEALSEVNATERTRVVAREALEVLLNPPSRPDRVPEVEFAPLPGVLALDYGDGRFVITIPEPKGSRKGTQLDLERGLLRLKATPGERKAAWAKWQALTHGEPPKEQAPRRFLIQCGNVQDVLTVQTGAGEWEITLPGDRTVDDSLGDLNAALQALEATSEEALAAYRQWCVVAGVSVDEKAVPRSAAWIGPRQARTRAREAAPESASLRKRTQPVTQRHPDLCRPRRRGLPSFPVAQVPVLH